MESWFEELFFKRKRFDESVRENNFEKGIRRSTVEKYADPVHFVYELLQNAEDQGATKAQFTLSSNALAFRHNGNPFARSDVENITGIGNSDKTQEANKIGRFGIGFKSIFAITDRPEIDTFVEKSQFAFAIEHLVVPVAIPIDHGHDRSYQTHFLFPFLKGQEEILYAKIEERLSTLGFETLLFLQNLTALEWHTENNHGIYQHDIRGEHHILSRDSSQNGQQRRSTTYLLFTRKVSVSDRELDVRLAFKLSENGQIIADPGQKLAVYFPTEQETGLQFRVHGPFLLTDNRANIKSDNETNSRLIEACALLLSESMQSIKEASLLTVDFLALLPIQTTIPAQFLPFYSHVREALKHHPFLPTADGTFVRATQGKLARGTGLRDLLDSQQLSLLYGVLSPLQWLSSEITDDRFPELYRYVTKSLSVEVISPESVVRKLERPFLEGQTDAWLVKLYTFLNQQPTLDTIIKGKPILRLEDNSLVAPFKDGLFYHENGPPHAYLPPKGHGHSRFPLIKRDLLTDDVTTFLRRIGLSEPDNVHEVLEFILPLYAAGAVALDDQEHNRHNLEDVQKAIEQKDHPARQRLLKALHDTSFVQAKNAKTSEKAWKKPQEVYIQTEELFLWFDGNEEAWFLLEPFPADLLENVRIPRQFRLNARTTTGNTGHVMIQTSGRSYKRGLHGFDPDAQLEGLQYVLDHITFKRALLLWKFLLEHRHLIKGSIETSLYQNFTNTERTEQFSHIGKMCSQSRWLPDEERQFSAPNDLFLGDLPEGFETNTPEAQEVAHRLGMKRTEVLELADKLDIPAEAIVLIQKNPGAFLAWCEQHQSLLPSSISSDPEWRKERAAELAYASGGKIYRSVKIHKRTSANYSEARAYLRHHHTNSNSQLICQFCDQKMPFKLPRGDEFFVACQYIESVEKEYCANYLALCPNCAAEFQNACQTHEREKADRLFGVKITTNEQTLFVPLDMPVHQHLRFTHRHLIDLQMAIKDWLEMAPDPGSSVQNPDPYDLL